MIEDPFGKWWPCLKKHFKRTTFWLPHVKRLASSVQGREFRYFTLCARPMIDVYMLVKEKVLPYDQKNKRITGVYFCECVEANIGEMREMIGVEEAGTCGFLEDLVLFEDSLETTQFKDDKDISKYVDREGERISETVLEKLKLKRAHLNFRKSFPFDFVNLDYCDPYYPLPKILRVHEAVEQLLRWQTDAGTLSNLNSFTLDQFVIAITCRTDLMVDSQVTERLQDIVQKNCDDHPEYNAAVEAAGRTSLEKWSREDLLDFFMAAWPKEIARIAASLGWDIEIKSHSHYERTNSEGDSYHMICLVAEFSRATLCSTYLAAALNCLNSENRSHIRNFDPAVGVGANLAADLKKIVGLRNRHAREFGLSELPDPLGEIKRLEEENAGD